MIFSKQFLIILSICILLACACTSRQKNVVTSKATPAELILNKEIQKIIKLKYNFEIKAGRGEDFGTFKTYMLFILTHNNKPIYTDTSSTEYEFGDKLYPLIRAIDSNTFEVLAEVNRRPGQNELSYFKIHQDKISDRQIFPIFISKAKNLDDDPALEYAGFWESGETWGQDNSLMGYSPIIYYEIKPDGLQIDSILTIAKNKSIYGAFKGFDYDAKSEMPVSTRKKFNAEIKRISL